MPDTSTFWTNTPRHAFVDIGMNSFESSRDELREPRQHGQREKSCDPSACGDHD